jgi:putative tryptophan/tyrosine transport system substrate-binding protein
MQFNWLKRREFLTLLGGAVAWPLAARAQQAAMPVVGFLRNSTREGSKLLVASFRQGLREAGYVEGQNILVEYRFSENRFDQMPLLAADLVHRQCAVIIAGGAAAALATKAVTRTIPILFSTGDDPINIGLVESLARPGGNVTGIFYFSGGDLESKQLELLRELAPKTGVIGVLVHPLNPETKFQLPRAEAAARALGLQIVALNASSERDFEKAFAALSREQFPALLIAGDALFTGEINRLAALTVERGIPATYFSREFAAAGGLMSYGPSITDSFRELGAYTRKILTGAKPADLPVLQATKFELVFNLKTAKALGINIPFHLQQLADEIIE